MRQPPRPRDDLGRPLARDSGVPLEPDPHPLPPQEALAAADSLLRAGRAFRAHEVLEATWKATTGPERDLWRGLAQLAVGVTHAQRGNALGGARLLERGAATLQPWHGQQPHGVDVAALRAWAAGAAAAVTAGGEPPPVPPLARPASRG